MLRTLENGLRVVVVESRAAPVVALQMWVNTGSADDPVEHAGIAHVLEHMVFKGTARRGVGDVARTIEGSGGDINAWTSFDQTVYHIVMASRFFARGLDVLADTMRNTSVDAKELKSELKVVLEEIKEGKDSPSRVASREMFGAAYKKHPYGRPVIGYASAVEKLDHATVKRFFRERYVPSNMTLVVVGDIDRADAIKRIERAFSGAPRLSKGAAKKKASKSGPQRLVLPPRDAEPRQRSLRVSGLDFATQETQISIAFHIPAFVHEDTPALDLGSIVLGQGDASRLVQRVRHDKQLVSDVYSYAYSMRDPGLLIVHASTQPSKVARATRAIIEEVFALAQRDITSSEIKRAQTLVESDRVYQQETVQGLARRLGYYASVVGDLDGERRYQAQVAAATPAAVRAAMARYVNAKNMTISIVGPGAKKQLAAVRGIAEAAQKQLLAASKKRAATKDRALTKVTLKNGARLVFLRDRSVPLVAMRAVWKGGLRYENAGNNGINHLLAAMLTRGTTKHTSAQINAEIEGMAGAIGGFSGRNSLGLRTEVLGRHWQRGMEIMAECLLSPAFRKGEFAKVRRETLEDLRAQQDNLGAVAMRTFQRTLYTQHPYGMDVLGSDKSVRAMTVEQLSKYYKRHFRKSQMVLAVIGDADPAKVTKKFEQLFGGGRRTKHAPPAVPKEPPRKTPQNVLTSSNKAQAHVVVGYPGTTLQSKDRYALEVLTAILSGQSGRLFLSLRERQGLAYRVSAFALEGLEPGYVAAYMATSPDNIQKAIDGFEREFERLRQKAVPASELARIKRYLAGSHDISLQRRATVAALVALDEVYGLGYRTYLDYADRIIAVTAADVQRVAKKYLDNKRRVITVVHPEKLSPGAEKVLGALRSAGVTRKRARAADKAARSKKR